MYLGGNAVTTKRARAKTINEIEAHKSSDAGSTGSCTDIVRTTCFSMLRREDSWQASGAEYPPFSALMDLELHDLMARNRED